VCVPDTRRRHDMTQVLNPVPAASADGSTATLREFATYEEAQALVDRLPDAGFPVEGVRIVGTGMHSVEQVTGRMTTERDAEHVAHRRRHRPRVPEPNGRASAGWAVTGAWFGLLVGLLLSLFAVPQAWPAVLLGSLAIGTLWGASSASPCTGPPVGAATSPASAAWSRTGTRCRSTPPARPKRPGWPASPDAVARRTAHRHTCALPIPGNPLDE
jgi:hypothetical protein